MISYSSARNLTSPLHSAASTIISFSKQAGFGNGQRMMDLYERIQATWARRGIIQKMHCSEAMPRAIAARQRRRHSPRVATLQPCPPDIDLIIEAKDKELVVFELMRTFKLPSFDALNDNLPYPRTDESKAWNPPKKKTQKKRKRQVVEDVDCGARARCRIATNYSR
jgi:UV DNA damage endonuclease